MDEFDLDRAAEVGWAGFLTRLAGHLVSLEEPLRVTPYGADSDESGDARFPVLVVEVDDDGDADDDGGEGEGEVLIARLFVPGGCPWPEESRHAQMISLGWSEEPGGAAYLMRTPRAHAHLMAAALTDTLRKVVGAPHPAFLDAGALSDAAPTGPDQSTAPVPELNLDAPVLVTSPAELRQAVETVLHAAMGHPPRHDADGDIPIVFGTTLVYVRTADSAPVVSIFAVVVQDVADLAAARREVGILNRQSVFGKFHLVGDQIVASVAIPSLPFVPRHLVGMLELMGKELDQLDDALALRVQGRRWVDLITGQGPPADRPAVNPPYAPQDAGGAEGAGPRGDAEDPVLPDELLTLLQLHADGEPRLEPSVVADLCHQDRAVILRLIRIAEEQTLAWREFLDQARRVGDAEEARVATGELRGWETTVRDLRGALRHLVTFGGEEGRSG